MPKIVLVTTYGDHNAGDEAQALSVIHRLKKALPEADLAVSRNFTEDRDEIPGCTRVPLILWVLQALDPPVSRWAHLLYRVLGAWGSLLKDLVRSFRLWRLLAQAWLYARTGVLLLRNNDVRQLFHVVRSSDLFYIAGGGNWNDIWLWTGLVPRMVLVRLFHYFRKPIVISGQGVGPLESRFGRRFLRGSLKGVNLVTFRDFSGSEELLRSIGVRGPEILSVGDDSLGLEPESPARGEALVRETGLDPSAPLMGVQVRLTTWHRKEALNYTRTVASILDHMVESFSVKILFVPSEFQRSGGWDDRDHAYHVRRFMRHWRQTAVIHSELAPAQCKAVVARCRMFLATAYHPCVFALEACLPTVGLYSGEYHTRRARGLFRHYGLDACAIPYEDATPEKVARVFRSLLADPEVYRRSVQEVNARIRHGIDVPIQRVSQLLQKPGPANAQGRGRRPQV